MALFINLDALFSHHGQMKAGGWKMGSGRMTGRVLFLRGEFSAHGLKKNKCIVKARFIEQQSLHRWDRFSSAMH